MGGERNGGSHSQKSIVTLLLIIVYLAGLTLGGRACTAAATLIMFLPQALILVFAAYSFAKKDYLTGIAALVMLLEIGVLVYMRATGG